MSAWGEDITILVAADFAYLPGAFALANSAIENGFLGRIEVVARGGVEARHRPSHPQLGFRQSPGFEGPYLENIHRLAALPGLPAGRYLMLDADIVFERPAGILFEALKEGVVVNAEPEPKYAPCDVLAWRQRKTLEIEDAVRPFPYVNVGLVGFVLPRDAEFIGSLAGLCERHLRGKLSICEDPDWFFIEQDVMNALLSRPSQKAFCISPRQLELGASTRLFWDRPFPWMRQQGLRPADQLKYIIHGAGLRRPWLMEKRAGSRARSAERLGIAAVWRKWRRKLTPYERAWAFYACRENLPIPISFWAEAHGFTLHRSALWRAAHGLE